MFYRDKSDADFIKAVELHVAMINDAIAGIPRERVRLHVCYGNWEGPHIHDIALEKILPALYQAAAGALSIEFANPRIEEAVAAVGDRERVIASTDCGFGTFTRREWVIEPVVWLKLGSVRAGADIASARLWSRKVT